ncbi:MAG: DNA replication and repair protein RecF [Candidatus Woesebacteria bacterium]|jgi:DNA replication and repair protein RecF
MAYSSLSLKNFRSYVDYFVDFSPGVNIVVGQNGSGKTNLLEAVYVLSYGSSFRVSDKEMVKNDAQWFRVDGVYDEQRRILTYKQEGKPAKQFTLDGVKNQRLMYAQRVPLVLFEPNELRLLNGSPQRRRDYLDVLIGRLWPAAGRCKGQFERALLQRNNMLKQAAEYSSKTLDDQFFVWDIKLAEYAQAVVQNRLKVVDIWNGQLSELYSSLAGTNYSVKVDYKTDILAQDYKQQFIAKLNESRQKDIYRGYTSVGPHRDDYTVILNGSDAAVSASRGEVRCLVLAIKMIELNLLKDLSERKPILLMDDVFSELDASRRQALAKLAKDYQTIITTTDADHVTSHFAGEYKVIKSGD